LAKRRNSSDRLFGPRGSMAREDRLVDGMDGSLPAESAHDDVADQEGAQIIYRVAEGIYLIRPGKSPHPGVYPN